MYKFSSNAEGDLTCRQWLLDPAGCPNQFCRYTHAVTGMNSPPSLFVCSAYKNGVCPLSQDRCLFTHPDTGPGHQNFRFHHTELSLRDIPIAEAAAKAGFDISNWQKLKGLVDAVRGAESQVSYPDRWTGPAAFRSAMYPDCWRAGDSKPRRSVLQAYRDADKATSVPAFVVPADQIIRNLKNTPSARNDKTPGKFTFSRQPAGRPTVNKQTTDKYLRVPSRGVTVTADSLLDLHATDPQEINTAATGTNRQPLGLLSGNKRAAHGPAGLPSPAPKRFRNGATPNRSHTGQTALIDLTADTPITSQAPAQRPPYQGLSKGARKKARARARLQTPAGIPEQTSQSQTISILARIASHLHASAADLDSDRDVLRQRWEIDDDLKDEHVTDLLRELNGCFQRAEEDVRLGAAIMENKLLRRS